MNPVIIVHGGAGKVLVKKATVNGVRKASTAGYEVMLGGGSALDAVEAAVKVLENAAQFNAGYGSYPTLAGTVQNDAAIMDSELHCGAVAGIVGIKNPISFARKIMDRTDHVLFVGEQAGRLADIWKLKRANLLSPRRKARWEKAIRDLKAGKQVSAYFKNLHKFLDKYGIEPHGTVGAVARDKNGLLAAATSTGGIFLQLPGRVGDTPVIGCGNFADKWGACSATGHGEGIIRLTLTKMCVMQMEFLNAKQALRKAMERANELDVKCGVIGIDHKGNLGYEFNTVGMSFAYFDKSGKIYSYGDTNKT
ncbi:MAG: isoaspartyl peptidase/L-asparaginase family protein [Candidatus Wallbacteria bacterium]|nr:isoaspartyl peptidase/L-asparaginase family protein [Candidatus Wallbacteria bacterium]